MVSVTTKQLTGSKPAALALTLVTTDIQYNQNQPPAPPPYQGGGGQRGKS